MRKYTKVVLLVLIISMLLFLLTGCGNNSLVTTQVMNDGTKDRYTEKNIIEFKDDIADTIETIMEFDLEESAYTMYAYLLTVKENPENSSMNVKIDGKTVTTTNTMKSYTDFKGMFTEELTKDYVKDVFISIGYSVN